MPSFCSEHADFNKYFQMCRDTEYEEPDMAVDFGIHEMARENERLKEENAKLREELASIKANPGEKLRQEMLRMLGEAKKNILQREEEISRMVDEGCPNSD